MNYLWSGFVFLMLCSCNATKHQARIVLLPDTQTYAEKYPEILHAQVDWIAKSAKDITLVLQQGDLTQNNSDKEWKNVQDAFSKLNNKVPYVLAVGNHDMGSAPGKYADIRNSKVYGQYFPYSQMSALPGFGGVFEEGKLDNAYYFIQTGKVKWVIITLEFGPRNSVLKWAGEIADRYSDRIIILNTHSYLYSDSTRQGPGDNWRPQNYGVGKDRGDSSVNDGEEIWTKLVRSHPNIRFVFSGHVLNGGLGTLVSINDQGYYVYQMLANYQEGVKGSVNGGNGMLRILDMDFKKRTLKVSTWSPHTNQSHQEEGQNFTIREVLYSPGR